MTRSGNTPQNPADLRPVLLGRLERDPFHEGRATLVIFSRRAGLPDVHATDLRVDVSEAVVMRLACAGFVIDDLFRLEAVR